MHLINPIAFKIPLATNTSLENIFYVFSRTDSGRPFSALAVVFLTISIYIREFNIFSEID